MGIAVADTGFILGEGLPETELSLMERNDDMLSGLLVEMARTGALLSNARRFLSKPAFDHLLDEHDISPYHAATAMELFEKLRIAIH